MKLFSRERLSNAVIFTGMIVNLVVILTLLYLYA